MNNPISLTGQIQTMCKKVSKNSRNAGAKGGCLSRARIIFGFLQAQAALLGILFLAGAPGLLALQVPVASTSSAPAITFSLDFPQSNPAHYTITVDTAGHALYQGTAKVEDASEAQPYRVEFEVWPGNSEKIFELAKQARYFAGKIDSGNSKIAFTGTKRLSYRDATRSNNAEYNYSNLEAIRQLTSIFESVAATLEYGKRLAYYHRYEKLALDEELKNMVAQAKAGELIEIQSIIPTLQEIMDDPSVLNVVRSRAKELINMGSATPSVR